MKSLKVYSIIPRLLYQSAKTHDLTNTQRIQIVEAYKIKVVVNLWHTVDEDMRTIMENSGGVYIHKYFPDGKSAIFDDLQVVAGGLYSYLWEHKAILCHCYGGRNRSGLLNAMLVMHYLGLEGEQAYTYIRERRPNSLVNETFANWLKQQEITL